MKPGSVKGFAQIGLQSPEWSQLATEASSKCFIFIYFLLPHWMPATWRRRVQTSIKAEFPSGKLPTTRVQRRISWFNLSITLLVRMGVQCSLENRSRSSFPQCHLPPAERLPSTSWSAVPPPPPRPPNKTEKRWERRQGASGPNGYQPCAHNERANACIDETRQGWTRQPNGVFPGERNSQSLAGQSGVWYGGLYRPFCKRQSHILCLHKVSEDGTLVFRVNSAKKVPVPAWFQAFCCREHWHLWGQRQAECRFNPLWYDACFQDGLDLPGWVP